MSQMSSGDGSAFMDAFYANRKPGQSADSFAQSYSPAPASAPAIASGGTPQNGIQFHPPDAASISAGGSFGGGGANMSILGGLPGADPFSGSSGFGTGSSSGTSSGSGSSQQSTQMIPGMQGIYSQLLGMNAGNYQNVMNAYQGQKSQNAAALPGVYQGYGQLGTGVMNTLGLDTNGQPNGSWGVAAPAAQAIGNTYQQQLGSNTQQMASAGLGNTTVGGNMANQAAQAAALSYGQLGSQLASTAAGYQSQIGQAGLAAQMQGLGMQTGLTQAALGPLGQQFANTAGSLTGSFGSSQYTNQSQQQAQNRNQQQSNSGGGGNQGGGNNLPPGVPGGPGGGYGTGGGGSGGGGGGYGSAPGYDSAGAFGTGGNNALNPYGPIGQNPNGPGGPQTISPYGAASATGGVLGAMQGAGLGGGVGGLLGAAANAYAQGNADTTAQGPNAEMPMSLAGYNDAVTAATGDMNVGQFNNALQSAYQQNPNLKGWVPAPSGSLEGKQVRNVWLSGANAPIPFVQG